MGEKRVGWRSRAAWGWAWLAVAVAIAGAARESRAQRAMVTGNEVAWPALSRDGAAITGVLWGYDGTLSAEEHCPVLIEVSGGADGVQGAVTLEYPQDMSQKARVVVPVSAAPGAKVVVEGVVCVPNSLASMRVSLRDVGGRSASVLLSRQNESPPPATLANRPVIVVVGACSASVLDTGQFANLAGSFGSDGNDAGIASIDRIIDDTKIVRLLPSELPTAWMAYESVDVVIAQEDDLLALPTPVRQALLAWVHSGGRLVVVLSAAGQRWRELLPAVVAADVLIADDLRPRSLDDALRSTLRGVAAVDPSKNPEEAAQEVERAFGSAWPVSPARAMTTTPATSAMGWSVRWPCDVGSGEAKAWLIGEGPAGFGVLTLVGVDPARVGSTQSQLVMRTLWRDVVKPLMPAKRFARDHQYAWWSQGSGVDEQARLSLGSELDGVLRVRPIGAWVFFVLIAGGVVLALLVGPIGRFILKRKKRLRWSWLFSLASIGVGGIAALLLPVAARSGKSSMARVVVRDVLADASGRAVLEARTELASLFADRPVRHDFAPAEYAARGGWWRGVSPTSGTIMGPTSPGAIEVFVLPMSPAVGGVLRSALPTRVDVPQWNYRAFLGCVPAGGELGDVATRVSLGTWRDASDGSGVDDGWEIRVRGVAFERVESILVAWRGDVRQGSRAVLTPRSGEDGAWSVRLPVGYSTAHQPTSTREPAVLRVMPLLSISAPSPHILAMARERSDGLTRYVQGNERVLVVIETLEEDTQRGRQDVVKMVQRVVLPAPREEDRAP